MIYSTLSDLLHVAERTLGVGYAVRDYGLLEAALARLNGRRLTLTNDQAYDSTEPRAQSPDSRFSAPGTTPPAWPTRCRSASSACASAIVIPA